ncbi:MAG: NAD(P)H-binding protein [Dehalococcoidia bacterium]
MLLTGGRGGLGAELVPRLRAAGHQLRISSRKQAPPALEPGVEWAQSDLLTGEGLTESVSMADAIVHAASSPFKKTVETDVDGTKRLLDAARAAGVEHFYYISIVGVDRMKLPYYKAKHTAEQAIEKSGVPYTILRATQFHTLLDTLLQTLFKKGPLLFVPRAAKFQPIETGEVADHMVETLANGPSGRLPDIGGPEVLPAGHIADTWVTASGTRVLKVPVPALGPAGELAKGLNTCPENKFGKITWAQWLQKTYGSS